jgi:hypothetical protein
MIWIYIIISAVFSVMYFAKIGKLHEAITVFLLWPIIIFLVIILSPVAIYKKLKEKKQCQK